MDKDGPSGKGLAKQRSSSWDEEKGVRNEIVGGDKGLGSYEESNLKINGVAEQVNSGFEGENHVSDVPEKQQPQGSKIQWEDFLPRKSLKIMLVEDDDSTRHVVSALLRNCSYEVIAVANGLQAWKILEDMTNHIDLILTEVAMPILSGIGLLCKIMNHKTFKNIPVIMMSSHDSMGLVFRCLSKGAVDFLVKPIRKNELKNLWQHIWRRCHSSSGSGSESGTQTKTYAKSKSNDESGNNTGSNDEREDGSIGLSIRNGSDSGSGTQSSWTKRAVDVDSPRQVSHRDQLADTHDSTCAQVIHTKTETFSSRWVQATETKEFKDQNEKLDNVAMGKDLEMCTSIFPDTHLDYQHKCTSYLTSERQDKLSELDNLLTANEQMEYRSEPTSGKLMNRSVKLISLMANSANLQMEIQAFEPPTDLSDVSRNKIKPNSCSRELPPLELSLKEQRGEGNVRTTMHDGRNVLKHSDLSAFSKYNTASSASQTPTGNVGSCSPLDNSSVSMKKESMHNSLNQQSNESSNRNEMAYNFKSISRPEAPNDKSQSVSAFKCFHSSAGQPVQNVCLATQQLVSAKTAGVTLSKEEAHARGSDRPVVQHHHHHYHHYHHHHVSSLQHQSQLDHEDNSLKNMTADAAQCGSSNMLGGPVEGNARFHSKNGSASESNHGSNGRNGSSNGLNTGVPNMESDNGATGNSGANGIYGGASGSGADEDWLAQTRREAALKKFRQKRKERCFEKKVRYHSRKKLAEQRPRVRGQFVRHIESDSKAGKDEQDNLAPKDNAPKNVQ